MVMKRSELEAVIWPFREEEEEDSDKEVEADGRLDESGTPDLSSMIRYVVDPDIRKP